MREHFNRVAPEYARLRAPEECVGPPDRAGQEPS
jgi:hypothetical protein